MDRLHLTLTLAQLACFLGALMGGYAVINPAGVLRMKGFQIGEVSRRTIAEVRATYGGRVLLGHAATLAALMQPDDRIGACLAAALGSAWIGAAAARVISILVDRVATWRDLRSIGLEVALGILLWGPLWTYLRMLRRAAALAVGGVGGEM